MLIALAAPLFAPQLLAFPYRASWRGSEIRAERPLPPRELDAVMRRAAMLVGQSPLAKDEEPRSIFLTQGGWRWLWLANRTHGAFALTRPLNEAVVVNRNDLARDQVFNAPGRIRSLSGVIAHETCHGMERRRFGVIKSDVASPQWLREGYCDYVAQESTLSDAEVARLKSEGRSVPALVYHEGRKRVAAELERNGGDVEALFAAY